VVLEKKDTNQEHDRDGGGRSLKNQKREVGSKERWNQKVHPEGGGRPGGGVLTPPYEQDAGGETMKAKRRITKRCARDTTSLKSQGTRSRTLREVIEHRYGVALADVSKFG